jgi:hypothetical protein
MAYGGYFRMSALSLLDERMLVDNRNLIAHTGLVLEETRNFIKIDPGLLEIKELQARERAFRQYIDGLALDRAEKVEARNNIDSAIAYLVRQVGRYILISKENGLFQPGRIRDDNPDIPRLVDYGISYRQSANAQRIAAMKDDDFEDALMTAREDGTSISERYLVEYALQKGREEAVKAHPARTQKSRQEPASYHTALYLPDWHQSVSVVETPNVNFNRDSVSFLWTPLAHIPAGLKIIERWGMHYMNAISVRDNTVSSLFLCGACGDAKRIMSDWFDRASLLINGDPVMQIRNVIFSMFAEGNKLQIGGESPELMGWFHREVF